MWDPTKKKAVRVDTAVQTTFTISQILNTQINSESFANLRINESKNKFVIDYIDDILCMCNSQEHTHSNSIYTYIM